MSYHFYFAGVEQEGYYDILTGRPRYPVEDYNPVRQDRYLKRLATIGPEGAGAAFTIPELAHFLNRAAHEKRYSRIPFPAII